MKHNEVKHEIKKVTLKATIASLFATGVLLSATPVFSGTASLTKPTILTEADSKLAYGCLPKSWKSAGISSSEEDLIVSRPTYFKNVVCGGRNSQGHAKGF